MADAQHKALLCSADERLSGASSALLVIDMQNDFCAPGGYISSLGIDVSPIAPIVPCLAKLIDEARQAGVPVIWVFAQYEDHLIPRSMLARKQQQGVKSVCCAKGSWGGEPFGVSPADGERVILKHNYDAFHQTDLDQTLRDLGVETLVFAGVQTNVCVESAVRHAHSLGYYTIIAADCVASHMQAQHEASLKTLGFLFADLLDSDSIARNWRAGREGRVEEEAAFAGK